MFYVILFDFCGITRDFTRFKRRFNRRISENLENFKKVASILAQRNSREI